MDPITHALIGAAVSAAGQESFTLTNPITISAVIGSIIPDGDIILRAWGGSFYLKHHRGVSHSLIGITVESAVVGAVVKMLYPSASLLNLFIWAFVGALTHIVSDILNSYGAKIFWPVSKRKHSLSIITITDPIVIIMLILSMLSSLNKWGYNKYLIAVFAVYILSKVIMRIHGTRLLEQRFSNEYNIEKIHLLPAMIANYKLHYIIEDPVHKIVGEINFLSNKIRIISIFRAIDHITRENILKSKAAKYFKEFTPIFHVGIERIGNGYKALLTDLRYILNNEFMHHATIIYDEKMNIVDEKFNPYNINNKLSV